MSNAIKFTPPHGRVTCIVSSDAESIEVEVSDTGCGLSEANIQRLFKNVVQFHAKATQDGGGSGLGLWISKKIMELHEGSISVTSDGEGRGSTFKIKLPLLRNLENVILESAFSRLRRSNEPPRSSFRQPIDAGSSDPRFLRILIVDDSAMNRKMLRRCFTREGYVVTEPEDGEVAVRLLSDDIRAFDVVSLDNLMPRMSGPEAAKEMRRMGFRGKIVGVTGNALKEDIDAFISHGVDAVLPKPIDVNDFRRIANG